MEPFLAVGDLTAFSDAGIELDLQIDMLLGEGVAGNAGLDGERDDGQGSVGGSGPFFQDAVHRGADARPLVGRPPSWGSAFLGEAAALVLGGELAELGDAGAQPLGERLGGEACVGLLVELVGLGDDVKGVLVSARDVGAGGDAAFESRGLLRGQAQAEALRGS